MPVSRTRKLDLAPTERVLHPTKGYRKVSVKRSRAAVIAQAVKQGISTADLALVRSFLATGA